MVNDKPEDIKTYYIAYFDILGYRAFFKEQPEKIQDLLITINDAINDTINCIKQVNECTILKSEANIDIKTKIFSDNVLICMESLNNKFEQVRLLAFLGTIYDIQRRFVIYHGLFIRGSILRGKISFNDNFIFGQGLIDAVQREETEMWPRIIIDSEIVCLFQKQQKYTPDELKHAIDIENKINNHEEISSDEMVLYERVLYNVNVQQFNQKAASLLINRLNDNVWFLSYLHKIDKIELIGYKKLQFIMQFLQSVYPQDFETFSQLAPEDIDNMLIEHKKRVEENLKKFGSNCDIALDTQKKESEKEQEVEQRQKILRKYLWVMSYHNFICEYYKKREHYIYVLCGCDPHFLKMTIEVKDYEN